MQVDDKFAELDAAFAELSAASLIEATEAEQIKNEVVAEAPLDTVLLKETQAEQDVSNIRNLIQKMRLPQKIKAAMFGNSVCRSILINDSNKMIQQFTLKNPQLQQHEVEGFVKNPQMSEFVLRTISERKEWMRHYGIKFSLVSNPRTPQDIALKWLRYLNNPEIKKLAASKSIPQLIAVTAKKRLAKSD